jgi:alpha-glucoside transport system substrate-binding protein
VAVACAACGGTTPNANAAVTILIPWDPKADAGEYNAFKAVTDQFRRNTGIEVNLQVTRGVPQQLEADLAAGDPPDVADLASAGALYQFKDYLQPLRQISLRNYAQPWRGLATLGKGTVYAVPVKVDVQSLIWYSANAVKPPPATWTALQAASGRSGTPWCLGLASGTVSGWPGADWIADLLLSRYQVGAYKDWLRGALPWNSPQVTYAWDEWGNLLGHGSAVNGGVTGAMTTSFNQARKTGSCTLEHGALIATGLTSTTGYNYARFPSVSGGASPTLVSGDFMGLLKKNDTNAVKLLQYLASPQAQALWVRQDGGDAFSADQEVTPALYPEGVRRDIAGLLQPEAGTELCFAAGDVMTPDVDNAYNQAVLEYVNNLRSPQNLHNLLRSLQRTQRGAGSSPVWNLACSGHS